MRTHVPGNDSPEKIDESLEKLYDAGVGEPELSAKESRTGSVLRKGKGYDGFFGFSQETVFRPKV